MRAATLTCPHCGDAVVMRELRHQGIWASHRLCPHCAGAFVVDRDTRRRQAICIAIALLSLLFTGLLYFRGNDWLFPALASYAVLAALIYRGNRLVVLVPWPENENHGG